MTVLCIIFLQVVGSSMPLIGDHQAEDRQMIADVVLAKMNQSATRAPIRTQQRPPTAVQQPQVASPTYRHLQ